jgi:hypothetical protein
VNRVEARTIAQWIVENFASLVDLYHHQEEDPEKKVAEHELIGVVTPFAAQARMIRQEIAAAAKEAGPDAELPARLAQKITVGTAHRLQGAERPIILFSAVYGTTSAQSGFIDATPELMNVAVSRAKDHLVVFAAPNRWGNGPVFDVMTHYARRPAPVTEPGSSPADTPSAPDSPTLEPVVDAPVADGPGEGPTTMSSPPQRSLTSLLRVWQEAGHLREEDDGAKAASFNPRLAEIGLLSGEPGAWTPTPLAALLGVVEVEKKQGTEKAYTSIEFTAHAQDLLLRLYLDGDL